MSSITRRSLLVAAPAVPAISVAQYRAPDVRVFDVLRYGARGDGTNLDTAAFQKAIDAAARAGNKAQVLVRGGHRYLVGGLELRSNIDFHLADNAELLISTHREDYRGGGLFTANGAHNLTISGSGTIDGRAKEFMTGYDQEREIWIPREWRPKIFVLTACRELQIRDITFGPAPSWGLHMLGCDGVLVENLKIHNILNVPNCDGIDPDHCRNVTIRKCHITCGDDAIVIKSSRQPKDYGPSENIIIRDCIIETQDAGLKIGTETIGDIREVRMENCEIRNSSRGICIQLRDEGNISTIEFHNIKLTSRYFSDPWWGRGEAISFTAIPRKPNTKIGRIHGVRVSNVTAKSENSVRISGSPESRIRDVVLDNVSVTLDRWTNYPGGFFDNRPTSAQAGIEKHDTPGFFISYADDITLKNCGVSWGKNLPDYFSYAVESHKVTHLNIEHLKGHAAHPDRQKTTSIS
ncbi:MAG TPA: glycosyl hydrolase family 28 protein [Bryobacteraceae bacterium]|nr:glycosyl hydrolase family 28 protein [Bryobacteraceae bacterium]